MSTLILLVDDDADFLAIHRRILESGGYRVVTAGTGAEAMEKMAAEKPALVIADLMMERLDAGFTFARSLKDDPRFAGIPIILITAAHRRLGVDLRPAKPEDLGAMGVEAYFQKPVQGKALLEKARELLEARQSNP